jgi:phosphomannomutase
VNLELQDKEGAIKKLEEVYTPRASQIIRLDGLRCEFDRDWWFIARLSNTEPVLRLTIEAKNETLMKEKAKEMVKLITE